MECASQIKFSRLRFPLVLYLIAVSYYFLVSRWGVYEGKAFSREDIVSAGVVLGLFWLAGSYCLILYHFYSGKQLRVPRVPKLVGSLLVWTFWSTLALLIGFFYGNRLGYVLGDYLKFLFIPLSFFLVWSATKSMRDITTFYLALLIFWGVSTLAEILFFHNEIMHGQRWVSYNVVLAPLFCFLALFFLYFYNVAGWLRLMLLAVIPFSLLCVIVSQSRSTLAALVLQTGMLFWFVKKKMRTNVIMLVIITVSALLLSWVFSVSYEGLLFRMSMAGAMGGKQPGIQFIQAMGSRVPEVYMVIGHFAREPAKIVAGFGLGSEYNPAFLPKPFFLLPQQYLASAFHGHFIHNIFAEVLFRTGIVGLFVFVVLNAYCVIFAWHRAKVDKYGVASFILGVGILVGILTGGMIMPAYLLYVPLFAGMFKYAKVKE